MSRHDLSQKSHMPGGDHHGTQPFRLVLRGSPVTVFMQDRQLRYTWINNPAVGLEPDAVIGKTDDELFSNDEAATLRAIKLDVLTTGRGRRHEVRITHEGQPRYYDLTVEAICDRTDHVIGITGAAIDITRRRREETRQRALTQVTDALRVMDDPHDLMNTAAAVLRTHLHVHHATFGEVASDGQSLIIAKHHTRYPDRLATPAFAAFLMKALQDGRPLVIHHADNHPHIEPEVLEALRAIKAASFVAVPLLKAGQLVAVLMTYDPRPRVWDQGDVTLIEDVAQRTRQAVERARAERALRESETRYRLLSGLTSDYAFSYRIVEDGDHVVEWKSGAFERITGYPTDLIQTAADWRKLIHPDDLPVLHHVAERLVANESQSIELRIIAKDGETRWLTFEGQPVWDAEQQRVTRVIGAARDITLRKRIESERQQLLQRLEAERALIEEVIDQMPMAVIVVDAPRGKLLFANAQVQQITGYTGPANADGPWQEQAHLHAYLPGGIPLRPEQWPLMRALHEGEVIAAEVLLFHHPTDDHWITVRTSAAPVRDAAGRMVAAVSIFYDITEAKRAEKAMTLLARAGRILASSLDYETTLRSIVRLSVPDLADWCQLDIVTPRGELQTLAGTHADPERTKMIQAMHKRYPIPANASWGPWSVTRSGQLEWASEIHDDMLVEVAHNAEHLRMLREANLRSYISVPLKGRGRVLGVLTFVTDGVGSGRRYTMADVDLAAELARRAAMVIDKSLLYRDAQRELAERRATEHKLQSLNETLEQRVAERSAEAEQRAAQLRALAAELTQAEQRERRRLAQTLHDHLQQLLVAAKLRLHAMMSQFADDAVKLALQQIDELLTQSVDASRSLTIELSPPILHDAGLAAALDWLGRWMRDKHGLHVTVHADPAANPTTEDLRVLLFNGARELLFNIVKHAGTRNATVALDTNELGRVRLTVSDEGVGFNPAESSADRSGFGLFSIQQRLNVLGGETRIHSRPGHGTQIELLAPDTPADG
ncbi:MAG: PAS domain S-box protein [Phycisphaeraceae bacterium]